MSSSPVHPRAAFALAAALALAATAAPAPPGYTQAAIRQGPAGGAPEEPPPPPSRLLRAGRAADALGNLTVEVAVRHENNLFLTAEDRVADTVLSATPGVDFRFGRQRIRASLSYQHSFQRYLGGTAPSAALAAAAAGFTWERERSSVAASGSFQQLYQSNRDAAAAGLRAVIRRDLTDFGLDAAATFGAKTTLRAAPAWSRNEYRAAELTSTRQFTFPLAVAHQLTPKLDLSGVFTHRRVEAPTAQGRSRDRLFDLGARGQFTPLLSGRVAAGHRARRLDDGTKEAMWGGDVALDLALSPRFTSSFSLARDFGTSAFGESLRSSDFGLSFTGDLAPRWQVAGGLSYRRFAYGAATLLPAPTVPEPARVDHLWESRVSARYAPGDTLQTTLEYVLASNRSTRPETRYSAGTLSLALAWRY